MMTPGTEVRGRWSGVPAAVFGIGVAALAAALTLGFELAVVAARGPVLFQPVSDRDGSFVGTATGPFSQKYPVGVVDDGKLVPRTGAGADDFAKPFSWVSSETGGLVVQNLSGKPICAVTVAVAGGATFPTDSGPYQAPGGWQVTVARDAKQVTFGALTRPDSCVPVGGWFWVRAPKMSDPDGTPTLVGRLAFADAGADAVVVASLEAGPRGGGTPSAGPTPAGASSAPASPSGPASVPATPSGSGSAPNQPPTPTPTATPDKPSTPRRTPSSSRTPGRPGHSTVPPQGVKTHP